MVNKNGEKWSLLNAPGKFEVIFFKNSLDTDVEAPRSKPTADELVVEQLQTMGFSRQACVRACLATGSNLENASNWLMEHLDDADLNETLSPSTSTSVNVDAGALGTLLEMGISEELARRALESCQNDVEEAINMAFSNPEDLLSQTQQVQQSNAAVAAPAPIAKAALSDGDPSSYELIAFISHMGESTAVSCARDA